MYLKILEKKFIVTFFKILKLRNQAKMKYQFDIQISSNQSTTNRT